jgi:tetratricopeptide (TPR) repeat protein
MAPAWAQQDPPIPAQGPLTDAQAAELARSVLSARDPAFIRAVLIRLRVHAFHSRMAPEREVVLYAEGMLEDRLGNLAGAVYPLRQLEQLWPQSPYTAEAQVVLAEDAVDQKHFPEAEQRLHLALAADIPSEQKRRAQELLLWSLVQQGRPLEGLPIVKGLLPLEGDAKPSERGLAAMAEVLCAAGDQAQADGARQSFARQFPGSPLLPRVEFAYARMLGQRGASEAAARALRKLIQDHPRTTEADEARLALADLLTNGKLPEGKDLPTAQSLLDEIRKGGHGLPRGRAQRVELRLRVDQGHWGEALALVDGLDPVIAQDPEIHALWLTAWRHWVDERLAKGAAGDLIGRLKPGAFRALDSKERLGVAQLLASQGLLSTLPALLPEAPVRERAALRQAALAKADAEGQPDAVLRLLPARGGAAWEALLRARALVALARWPQVRAALSGLPPGTERIRLVTAFLQRPLDPHEPPALRLKEAEGWLARAPEKGPAREPLAILVGDLRFQAGDAKGALALYPVQPDDPAQRGWVALMRAQAMLKLGQVAAARALIRDAHYEQGFRGQRDALAKALGAY